MNPINKSQEYLEKDHINKSQEYLEKVPQKNC
jgi:hypothetical protein